MKNYIRITLASALAFAMLFLCGCSNDEPNASRVDYGRLRLGKMDLSGAVSIGLKGQGAMSRAIDGEFLSAGMYKIDAAGNISAVCVYFTTDTLGKRLEHEEILRVAPGRLFDLTKNYMLAVRCEYYDSDGDIVSDKTEYNDEADDEDYMHLIRQDVPYKNLLVRKSDGKIWCVDNISDIIIEDGYSGYEKIKLKGTFNEDSSGNLYFNNRNVYKFNLNDETSSFEQIASHLLFDEDFFIADNGVVWSFNSWPMLTFGWPHSGFQSLSFPYAIEDYISELERTIPGVTFYDGIKKIEYETLTLEGDARCQCANFNNQPIIITSVTAKLHYWEIEYAPDPVALNIANSIRESKWPVGILFEVNIGDTPQSAQPSKMPIELLDPPASALNPNWLRDGYGVKFNSVYVGDNYFLTSGSGNWITKIDMQKREWTWLKQLDFEIDFSKSLSFNNKVWSIDKYGAHWFDPTTFEDGFVKFNVDIPPYVTFQNFNSKTGKITFSGVNSANGEITTIVIDITTGEAVTDTQAPEMLFETLINLN